MSSLAEDEPSVRFARARESLEGLSCGDAFGECFFVPWHEARSLTANRVLPEPPWRFTDDTMMAISIASILEQCGEIDQDKLALHFADLYDPMRGYGPAMHALLLRIGVRRGSYWREEAQALFGGQGSFGNGAAMRVAPVGAYFADDLDKVVEQAERSATTTHCHPEAVAGAVAVALGAAFAWRDRDQQAPAVPEFLDQICTRLPQSEVRRGIEKAMELPPDTPVGKAALALGNGSHVSAADTVPFALWSAGCHLDSYENALWNTVSALGDRDTTCAIVGGVVVLRTGLAGVPGEWLSRREALPEL